MKTIPSTAAAAEFNATMKRIRAKNKPRTDLRRRVANGKALHELYAARSNYNDADRSEDYSITDPISDLLHFAHSNGFNVQSIIRSALGHFRAELADGKM